MSKTTREAIYLYKGFRPYVPKKKLNDYDTTFLNRKVYTVKFMTEFIRDFVNLRYYRKKLKDPNDAPLFNFFLLEFSQRYSKSTKAIKDFRETPRMLDRSFMYKNK